jgi:hypothetical protein
METIMRLDVKPFDVVIICGIFFEETISARPLRIK